MDNKNLVQKKTFQKSFENQKNRKFSLSMILNIYFNFLQNYFFIK